MGLELAPSLVLVGLELAPSLILAGLNKRDPSFLDRVGLLLSLIFGLADTLRVTYVVSSDLEGSYYLPGDLSVGLLVLGLLILDGRLSRLGLFVLSETLLRADLTLDLSCWIVACD